MHYRDENLKLPSYIYEVPHPAILHRTIKVVIGANFDSPIREMYLSDNDGNVFKIWEILNNPDLSGNKYFMMGDPYIIDLDRLIKIINSFNVYNVIKIDANLYAVNGVYLTNNFSIYERIYSNNISAAHYCKSGAIGFKESSTSGIRSYRVVSLNFSDIEFVEYDRSTHGDGSQHFSFSNDTELDDELSVYDTDDIVFPINDYESYQENMSDYIVFYNDDNYYIYCVDVSSNSIVWKYYWFDYTPYISDAVGFVRMRYSSNSTITIYCSGNERPGTTSPVEYNFEFVIDIATGNILSHTNKFYRSTWKTIINTFCNYNGNKLYFLAKGNTDVDEYRICTLTGSILLSGNDRFIPCSVIDSNTGTYLQNGYCYIQHIFTMSSRTAINSVNNVLSEPQAANILRDLHNFFPVYSRKSTSSAKTEYSGAYMLIPSLISMLTNGIIIYANVNI